MFKRLGRRFRMWREKRRNEKKISKIAASIDPDGGAVIKENDRVLGCDRQASSEFEFTSEGGVIKAHDITAAVAIANYPFQQDADDAIRKDGSVHVLQSGKYTIDPQRQYNQELVNKINEKRLDKIREVEKKLSDMKQSARRVDLLGI